MRQHLNNPWVVLGLCVGAVVIFYLNSDENVVQRSIPNGVRSLGLPKTSGLGLPEKDSRMIDFTKLDWPTDLKRDPFAPASHPAGRAQEIRSLNGEEADDLEIFPDALPPLQLTAVALEPKPKVAMINRKLVAEGDRIEGLRVARIESDGVWLKGPSGPHHLLFAGSPNEDSPVPKQTKILPRTPRTGDEDIRPKRETVLMNGRDCSRSSRCS